MISFKYAVYVYMLSLIDQTDYLFRMDNEDNSLRAIEMINIIGTKPSIKQINNDIVYEYSYGECCKPRLANSKDLDALITALGGHCDSCVSRMTKKE